MDDNKKVEPEVVQNQSKTDVANAEQNGLLSLILGVVSIVVGIAVLGFIAGIFAIKIGNEVKKVLPTNNPRFKFASIGVVCGWVSVGVSILFLIFWIYAVCAISYSNSLI